MTHGYSLRPNAKGRQVHQSTDDPDDDQVEGAVDLDLGPTTSHAAKHSERGITSSSIASCTSPQHQQHISATTRYRRVRVGNTPGTEIETSDEIRAGRKREEARCFAEAVRIRREQVVRGFEEEICALRARIGALREECEVRVARVRREWERAAIERRGEVRVDADSDLDADGEMDVENYAPTETSLTTDNGDVSTSSGVGPSRLHRQGRPQPQPQPLRRQPAQLMAIPISSLGLHAYGMAALVPENRLRDMDKDSEMGDRTCETKDNDGRDGACL
jgi:hypothetical protein